MTCTRHALTPLSSITGHGSHLLFVDEENDKWSASNLHLQHCTFRRLGLRNADVKNSQFQFSTFENCYFRKATLKDIDFTGSTFVDCNFEKASIQNCKFNYARFRGCTIDPDEIIESLPAEANLRRRLLSELRFNSLSIGNNHEADRYLLLEINARQKERTAILFSRSQYYRNRYGFSDKIGALLAYIRTLLSGFVWGHGLMMWRLVLSSILFIVILSTAVYKFKIPYRIPGAPSGSPLSFIESLYVNTITFCTVGFGDVTPCSRAAYILSTSEGFCGPIFLGLIAACLYRKITR